MARIVTTITIFILLFSTAVQARDLKCLLNKKDDVRYDLLELYTNIAFIKWITVVGAIQATQELGMFDPLIIGEASPEQKYSRQIHHAVDELAGANIDYKLIEAVELFSPEVYPPFWSENPILPIPFPVSENAYQKARHSMLHGHPDYSTLWDGTLETTRSAILDKLSIDDIARLNVETALVKFEDYRGETRERVQDAVPCAMIRKIKDKQKVIDVLSAISHSKDIQSAAPWIKEYFLNSAASILGKLAR